MLAEHEDALSRILSLVLVPIAFLAMMCLGLLILVTFYVMGGVAYLLAAYPPLLLIYVVCVIRCVADSS